MKLGEAIQGAVPLTETKPHLDLFDEVYSSYMKQKIRKKVNLVHTCIYFFLKISKQIFVLFSIQL